MSLIKMKDRDFDFIYSVMEEAFPAEERRTKDYLKKQIKTEKKFSIWLNEEKTSFITIWNFDKFKYIEHFASSSKERGKGKGAKIIKEVIENAGKPVVLEAEPVQTDMQKRRIGFYERVGFKVNEPYYFQPPMQEDLEGVELKILSCPDFLTSEEFENVTKTLHREVYKYND